MNNNRIYYFGIHPNVLEPVSLEYSSFGAFWYVDNNQRHIVGYGFGAAQLSVLAQFRAFSLHLTCSDKEVLYQIYRSIRDKQQEQDWECSRRLSILAAFKKPWSNVPPGWYILRSRRAFPLHLSIVRKTKVSVWLEHAAVCENEDELAACITKAEQIHRLQHAFKFVDMPGGCIHG
ncbi:hypothetical protein R70723_29080 [Paenibacillus sp. FSL R7-0273]|uniref:hypothetical protein n=1 Tax=Paenibacillus sp. FSL R7-0273 TaxID=1536772 RepID=UPI0004F792C3|nr:hypothetical protein [Paenibacillus sp. FSL R7-0273]AIQ49486.1 hypothetical protein R70723_29080 [Paenibacillus sp. FSL R7-0273]OMF89686.1 hypothetical protein BK144_19190 [Paenibacillus sp. FSL R7-0273]